jgi:hypothetical protein
MLVSFGYVNITIPENIIFDIVEMDYPHNVIFERGTLDSFEVIMHPGYFCMKRSRPSKVTSVYKSQEDARRLQEIAQLLEE